MRYSFAKGSSFFLGAVLVATLTRAADGPAAFSMNVQEFKNLSKDDQQALILSAFERRIQHSRNLHYACNVRTATGEYRDGHLQAPQVPWNQNTFQHWRLGDSYRMDIDRRGTNTSEPGDLIKCGFDTTKGVGRGTCITRDKKRSFGRIDVVEDSITHMNRYAYWLDGKDSPMGECLIRYVVDHRDGWVVEVRDDEELVFSLTVPWQPPYSDKPIGTREFLLDPEKGFLPVKGTAKWQKGPKDWRTEEFVVEKSQLVGDVWMPTKLVEIIGSDLLPKNVVNVWETEVTSIVAGNVTSKDLEIPFTKGMEIVDAIEGVSYRAGEHGRPAGNVQHLIGADAVTTLPPESAQGSHKLRYSLILVNVGVVLVLGAMLFRLLRKSRSAST